MFDNQGGFNLGLGFGLTAARRRATRTVRKTRNTPN